MRNCLTRLIGAAMLCGVALPAQAAGLGGEAHGARSEGTWGGETGLAYTYSVKGFSIRPIGGLFLYRGDNDRYYEDEFSNGDSRCRDSETGQFVKSSKCVNVAVKGYAKLEASYSISKGPELGAGVRYMGDEFRPYGIIAASLGGTASVRANVGPRYYAAGLTLNF